MAQLVRVDGQEYKKRDPLGVWGLTWITLGVYGFVWYFKINDEARRYLRDESIRPGIALLAVLLGWIIIVPPFISIYHTGERITRMQQQAGLNPSVSPAIGILTYLVAFVVALYYQAEINKVWDRAALPAPLAPGPPPPG
jgi:hypothetical protein